MNEKNPGPSSELVNRKPAPLGRLERMDRAAFRAVYFGTRNPVFNVFMPAVSIAANRGAMQIIVGSALVLAGMLVGDGGAKLKLAGLLVLASAGLVGVLAEGTIKLFWKRKRPFQVMSDVRPLVPSRRLSHRPSFPSGHSAAFVSAAISIAICFPHTAVFVVPFGLLGAYSRIYNGVHFPSDVLAGIAIGAGAAFLLYYLATNFVPPHFLL